MRFLTLVLSLFLAGCISQPLPPMPVPPQPVPIPNPRPVDPVPQPQPVPTQRDPAKVEGLWSQFKTLRDEWQEGKVFTKPEVDAILGAHDGKRTNPEVGFMYHYWLKADADGSPRDAYAGFNATGSLVALSGG